MKINKKLQERINYLCNVSLEDYEDIVSNESKELLENFLLKFNVNDQAIIELTNDGYFILKYVISYNTLINICFYRYEKVEYLIKINKEYIEGTNSYDFVTKIFSDILIRYFFNDHVC